MDRNPLVLNPVTCITHLLHPHNQIPLLHQQESFLDKVVNCPTPLLHPHAQLPKPSLSTLHQPVLRHLESQIAVKVSVLIYPFPALPAVKMMMWCSLAPFLAKYVDILVYKQIPSMHCRTTLYILLYIGDHCI